MAGKKADGSRGSRKVLRLEKRLAALCKDEEKRRRQLEAVHAQIEEVTGRLVALKALAAADAEPASARDGDGSSATTRLAEEAVEAAPLAAAEAAVVASGKTTATGPRRAKRPAKA